MADVQDIVRARRALAQADRVLGALARRYGDVIDDIGYAPGVDERYIHWPEEWLRQASQDEIFAWIAHHTLAWALGHDWRIPPGRRPAEYYEYETVSSWWYHPRLQFPRMASLVETSCVLYFSGRRPRGWRPLIDPEILAQWRGIPAEAILCHLRNIPDRMTIKEWLARGPVTEDPGNPDIEGDSDSDGDSDADGNSDGDSEPEAYGDSDSDPDADSNSDGDSNADGNSESDSVGDSGAEGDADRDGDSDTDTDADGDSAAIFEAVSDGDGDADGNAEFDADGNDDRGDEGDGDSDTGGNADEDADADGNGNFDSDTDSDADADADDGEMDGDPDGDPDADGDAESDDDEDSDADADAIFDDDGDACDVGADGRGDQPAPVSWRIRVQPPPEPIWVQTLLLEASGSERPDYLRHHRRHAASPVVIPSRRGDGVIVVSRDCSGSISEDQIEAETTAIHALRAAHPEAELILVDHDSEIARVVHDPTDEDLSVRPCDGGTDFRPVFDEAESMELSGTRIACLVLISDDLDGYMPEYDEEPRYPVVWLTSRWTRASVPFGEVIRYD